jgi:predicted nucleic acid-binding protein
MDNPASQIKTIQNIIIDTNILQYVGEKTTSTTIVPYLSDLLSRGFGLAISDISIYELLKGANANKEQEMRNILNLFQRYYLTENVLIASAQLETLYRADKIFPKQIGDGDILIGATAILTGSLIITANFRDYPLPFFKEVERFSLSYTYGGNHSKNLMIGLLSPDLGFINQKFSERPR